MKKIIFILILITILGISLLQAQTPNGATEFDWGEFGVNVTIVMVILTLVQTVKRFFPQPVVVWLPFVLAIMLSAGYGALTNTGDLFEMIRMALIYATAAAWLYDVGNKVGLLRSWKTIKY